MSNYKAEIWRLHKEGKNYREIQQLLGCSLCTISYHLVNKTRVDTRRRRKVYSRQNVLKLKEMLGGKCSKCGYNKCMQAIDFHHVDPSKKEGLINNILRTSSFKKAEEEAKKCILLCANCHREHHNTE
jgi:DNA-binding CsgD family transcriptional regulator